jgi:hypothetical protein
VAVEDELLWFLLQLLHLGLKLLHLGLQLLHLGLQLGVQELQPLRLLLQKLCTLLLLVPPSGSCDLVLLQVPFLSLLFLG